MSQVLVSGVDQENRSQSRGKHGRSPSDGPPVQLASASKRRALGNVTNQTSLNGRPPAKPAVSKPLTAPTYFQTTLDHLTIPAPSLLCPGFESIVTTSFDMGLNLPAPQPISRPGNDSTSSTSCAGANASFSLSTSFKSIGSLDSPMLLSSPDPLNTSLMCTEVIDIDQLEEGSTAGCGEYARDIFAYLREAEVRFHPKMFYMNKQPDITHGMRAILIDWLVEVAEEFKLEPETLYLAVSITDRFLSCMSVVRSKLQLVGTAGAYLASKFEEIYPPEIGDFSYITDDTYSKVQIVRMERLILKALDFNIVAPTPLTFLLRFLKATEVEQLQTSGPTQTVELLGQTITVLSRYLCELALQDGDPFLKYLPSVIAASAVCLARHTTGQVAWPPILQHYSGYSVSDIGHCLQDLHRSFAMAHRHPQQAIRQKYSSERYMKVASLKAPETLPC